MVDEFVRHEGMQQKFERRARRHRVEQVAALHPRHVVVGEIVERAQPLQRREPHRRHAAGLDRTHVAAGAFNAQHLDLVAGEIAHLGLDRRVAAAVQHECGIAAEQPRGVDA